MMYDFEVSHGSEVATFATITPLNAEAVEALRWTASHKRMEVGKPVGLHWTTVCRLAERLSEHGYKVKETRGCA